ncbi:hypothetical protein AMTRI_Chr02g212190 [Amborella trichopoda]
MPFLSLHQYVSPLHTLSLLQYELLSTMGFSHSLSSMGDSTKCSLQSIAQFSLSTPIWTHCSLSLSLTCFSVIFFTKMDRRKHDRATHQTPMTHYGSMQVKLNLITEKQ